MKKKPPMKMAGISPRAGVLQNLKEEAIALGIPEEDVIHETRQAEIKKAIKRFTDERDYHQILDTLKSTYIEYSGKLDKAPNPHLIEYPSDTLLKAEIRKLKTLAKKKNIDLD